MGGFFRKRWAPRWGSVEADCCERPGQFGPHLVRERLRNSANHPRQLLVASQLEHDRGLGAGGGRLRASRNFGLALDYQRGLRKHPIMPVPGRLEVGGRRVGGVVMGAPQIVDGPPSQTTDRERILPDMRYPLRPCGADSPNDVGSAEQVITASRSIRVWL